MITKKLERVYKSRLIFLKHFLQVYNDDRYSWNGKMNYATDKTYRELYPKSILPWWLNIEVKENQEAIQELEKFIRDTILF